MIKREPRMDVVEYIDSIECDVCHKVYDADDFIEIQEFHHINFQGGYGSVFGDGSDVTCDICQSCLLTIIDQYCRINGLTTEEWGTQHKKESDGICDITPEFEDWVEPVIKEV